MLQKMDDNNDGNISREEFSRHTQEHFARMDANHDGQVSQDEMRAFHEQHHPGRGHHGDHGHGAPQGAAGSGG
jgi:Ca2+-binding EF-hand superfamily protein